MSPVNVIIYDDDENAVTQALAAYEYLLTCMIHVTRVRIGVDDEWHTRWDGYGYTLHPEVPCDLKKNQRKCGYLRVCVGCTNAHSRMTTFIYYHHTSTSTLCLFVCRFLTTRNPDPRPTTLPFIPGLRVSETQGRREDAALRAVRVCTLTLTPGWHAAGRLDEAPIFYLTRCTNSHKKENICRQYKSLMSRVAYNYLATRKATLIVWHPFAFSLPTFTINQTG
jgi:hypothetical protein